MIWAIYIYTYNIMWYIYIYMYITSVCIYIYIFTFILVISVYVNISAHMGRVQYIQVSLNRSMLESSSSGMPLPANPKFKGWHGLTNDTRRYSHQITSNQQIHANSQWFLSKCVIIRHYHPPKKRTNILNPSFFEHIKHVYIYIYTFIILNRKKCDT